MTFPPPFSAAAIDAARRIWGGNPWPAQIDIRWGHTSSAAARIEAYVNPSVWRRLLAAFRFSSPHRAFCRALIPWADAVRGAFLSLPPLRLTIQTTTATPDVPPVDLAGVAHAFLNFEASVRDGLDDVGGQGPAETDAQFELILSRLQGGKLELWHQPTMVAGDGGVLLRQTDSLHALMDPLKTFVLAIEPWFAGATWVCLTLAAPPLSAHERAARERGRAELDALARDAAPRISTAAGPSGNGETP